jgi:hypothetical protein
MNWDCLIAFVLGLIIGTVLLGALVWGGNKQE